MTIDEALAAGDSFTIAPDGTVTPIPLMPGHRKLSLAQCQAAVEGYIELIPMRIKPKSWKMLVNEEGRLKRLPPNPHASRLALYDVGLVGTVLVTRHV